MKPEYVFNPAQALRRLAFPLRISQTQATTPWGLKISFDSNEALGKAMLKLGLSDLRTCELISRIVRPGDLCVDIGANIGIMASLMAKRAGRSGQVHAFEPHPGTRKFTERNVKNWKKHDDVAVVHIHPLALSDVGGQAFLVDPEDFDRNSGTAYLQTSVKNLGVDQAGNQVTCIKFDDFFDEVGIFRLVKVDVEGHEDKVFAGMERSLRAGRIETIIFEEMRALPSPACDMLWQLGYQTYLVDRNFFGLKLKPTAKRPQTLIGEATNVVAVRNPESIGIPFRPGWTCLRS